MMGYMLEFFLFYEFSDTLEAGRINNMTWEGVYENIRALWEWLKVAS